MPSSPGAIDAIHAWLRSELLVPPGARLADLGCGAGDDLRALAASYPEAESLLGLDSSPEWIARAKADTHDPRVSYGVTDLGGEWPIASGSLEAALSINLLECLPHPGEFLDECARTLRAGGSLVLAHWDWDTQTFDGSDRDRVRRIVRAFNEWQQAWMETIDPWAGRRLHRLVRESGAFEGEIRARTLIETSFAPDSYGRRQVESFAALVRRGLIPAEEYEAFLREQQELAAQDAFFFSVTMYAFVGRRRG